MLARSLSGLSCRPLPGDSRLRGDAFVDLSYAVSNGANDSTDSAPGTAQARFDEYAISLSDRYPFSE